MAPPGMMPNPAFAQWLQQYQAAMAIEQANQQAQAAFMAACELMRKDGVRGFRLDVEADSTIEPDEQAEKAARVEFLQQMIPMLQTVVPIAQGNPPLAEMASQMVLFAMRGFRVSRTLEEAFEEGFEAIAKMPSQQPPGQKGGHGPDPAVEHGKIEANVHGDELKAKTDMAAIAQKAQAANLQAQIAQQRAVAENERSQAEIAMAGAKLQSEHEIAQARMNMMNARAAGRLE